MHRAVLRSDSLHSGLLLTTAVSRGLPLGDIPLAIRKSGERAVTAEQRGNLQANAYAYAIIAGRPSDAVQPPDTWPESRRLGLDYLHGRFAEGDSVAAEAAGRRLEAAIGTPLGSGNDAAMARYAGGQHALDRGRIDRARRAATDLRNVRVPADSGWLREYPMGFALLLEAQIATARHAPEVPRLLGELDSALVALSGGPGLSGAGNLTLARLYETQGNLPRALAVIRRRVFDLVPVPLYVTYHREEARLAALNGDRTGAIRAYRRYLVLRSGADPSLQPLVAQVREELEALQRESTDR
jgi:hypothetical protein